MVVLDLNSLTGDSLALDETLDLGEVQGETGRPLVQGPARLAGSLQRRGQRFDLDARLTGRIALDCSRCLESFEVALDLGFFLVLVPVEDEAVPGKAEDDADDPYVYQAVQGRADLRAVAAEQVYLSLPLKPICDPGCRGLCPTCGANRNRLECACREVEIDPRLAPLLELKRRDEDR